MAAKKSAKKKTVKKTTTKETATKSAKKSAKKPTKKKSAKKKSTSAKSDSSDSKSDSKQTAAESGKPTQTSVSSLQVNMGHVFALRPRVNTSFKPGDFSTAKHKLREENYSSLPDAARAVVERALDLTRGVGEERRSKRF